MSAHFLYILSSQKNGTLYVGVTRNLGRRMYEHKMNLVPGFTLDHHVHNLVYIEQFQLMMDAVAREKKLKKHVLGLIGDGKEKWKIALIEKQNPEWKDLSHYVVAIEEKDGSPCQARG